MHNHAGLFYFCNMIKHILGAQNCTVKSRQDIDNTRQYARRNPSRMSRGVTVLSGNSGVAQI